jgi:hypothetical protein
MRQIALEMLSFPPEGTGALSSADFADQLKTARDPTRGKGQASACFSHAGTGNPAETRYRSRGGSSSNGPRLSAGYQIKCPIPNESKSSPKFQAVNPAIVPPDSFCQSRRPIRSACESEIGIDCGKAPPTVPSKAPTQANKRDANSGPLTFHDRSKDSADLIAARKSVRCIASSGVPAGVANLILLVIRLIPLFPWGDSAKCVTSLGEQLGCIILLASCQ